jgi:hypothetical protein
MDQPGQSRRSPATWTIATVLLLLGILGPLLVPIYARIGPELGGWPFFYWYQIIWVPITAIMVSATYLVLRRPGGAPDAPVSATGTEGER